MRIWHIAAAILLFASPAGAAPDSEMVVRAADGVAVHLYEYRPAAAARGPALLMFHMAGGDARGELDDIARRLSRAGRRVFTADLRGGGDRFSRSDPAAAAAGYANLTARSFAETPALCTAFTDVEAALDHVVRATGAPVAVTGSSYSAALAVQLAAKRPEAVAGFVAFSPASGEPMAGCEPERWLGEARAPGWAVRPQAEAEIGWIAAQRERWAAHGVATSVYPFGGHGTSILLAHRAQGDTEPAWRDFERFLDSLGPDVPVELASGDWRLHGDLRRGLGEWPRPAVLLLNSTGGDRRAYTRLAAELAGRGVTSLRLDLRGHGESVGAGRFDPGNPDPALISEAWRDVAAALATLRGTAGVDPARIGIVGAGYSGEAMAEAGRRGGHVRSYVALSPGSFSEASARAIDGSGARWLLMNSSDERFAPAVVERARTLSRTMQRREIEGARHGTDLLREPGGQSAVIAEWLAAALG